MTGQNYGQKPSGATCAPSSSQAVKSQQCFIQETIQQLLSEVDNFSSGYGLSETVNTLLDTTYSSLLEGAGLTSDRKWVADNPVNLTERHLSDLDTVFVLIKFLCKVDQLHHRLTNLKGGVEK